MSILSKYLTREICKYFCIVQAAVVGIYMAVDFFEKVDDFMEVGLSFAKTFSYLFYKTPFIVAQITPVGTLLAVLVVLGLMSKHNEIIALKSSGVGLYFLLKPVLVIGMIASLSVFFLTEMVVPIGMNRANRIWLGEVRKELKVASNETNVWIKGNRSITHIQYYNLAEKALYGVTLYYFDADFRLVRRIDARKALFNDNHWELYDLMEQNLSADSVKQQVVLRDRMVEVLDFLPQDLKKVVKKSEELTFRELLNYTRRIETEGYDATPYRVDLHAKVAFPLVCLIMSLLGMGIALHPRAKDALPVALITGIGLSFLCWVFYSFCLSLGYAGMLPPFVAAWTANLIFSCIGVVVLLHAL